jgi:hypothetical protein
MGSFRVPLTRSRHRVNISNAAVLGLQEDLKIVDGMKYNTALTIFFVPYVIFEIPSNILLKKLKPHVWRMYTRLSAPLLADQSPAQSSLHVHVHVRPGHNLSGSGLQLGWPHDHALVSG